MLGPHWYSSWLSFCGDPAALGLWVRSLHVLQQIIDGVDVGAGQVITLDLVLNTVYCQFFPDLPTKVRSPALAQLIYLLQQ